MQNWLTKYRLLFNIPILKGDTYDLIKVTNHKQLHNVNYCTFLSQKSTILSLPSSPRTDPTENVWSW